MVGCKIRLALRAVDNNVLDVLKVLGIILEPCREGSAAHTDKAALLDCSYKALVIRYDRRLDILIHCLKLIRFNNNKRILAAHRIGHRLDACYRTGHTGVHRNM